jgi:DNA repair exonuclease SbcCD ATPase subunit
MLARLQVPNLLSILEFSHTSEFMSYRKLAAMKEQIAVDPNLRLSDEDLFRLEKWPVIQNVFEKELPELQAVLRSYSHSFEEEMKAYALAVKELEKAEKLSVFYKSVLENLTKQYLDSLSGMLTEVYRNVYGVDYKSVQLVMDDFRNKKVVKLRIISRQEGVDFVEDFSAEGGAAHVILGLIVSVYFLLVTGGERIIIIDESLSQLGSEVLSRFLGVLRHFVDSLDFVFVIISHDFVRMVSFIDKAYVVENGVYRAVSLDDVRETALKSVAV